MRKVAKYSKKWGNTAKSGDIFWKVALYFEIQWKVVLYFEIQQKVALYFATFRCILPLFALFCHFCCISPLFPVFRYLSLYFTTFSYILTIFPVPLYLATFHCISPLFCCISPLFAVFRQFHEIYFLYKIPSFITIGIRDSLRFNIRCWIINDNKWLERNSRKTFFHCASFLYYFPVRKFSAPDFENL